VSTPWPLAESEAQVAIHNARVAISRAEDELAGFKDAEWRREVCACLSLADQILRGAFDHAG
jgi:hypothetical protein